MLLLPGRLLWLQPAEKPLGESSHEHVVIARRGEVVRIWPGKEFGAESDQEQEHNPGRRRRRAWGRRESVLWYRSGCPGVAKHLPAPASPYGAKGVESGSWWNCSRGKAAGQACRRVNARLPVPGPERIEDHSPAPTSGERKGREGDETGTKEQSSPPAALPALCHKQRSGAGCEP